MVVRWTVALAFLLLAAQAAVAGPTPAPSPGARGAEAHNGGVVSGTITSVDYQLNIIGLDAAGRGHLAVMVMPSTSIQMNDNAYHAITDVKAGQRVEIFSSIADGKYVAQIIRIRP
jgi:hypothetical protein